jgi:hypothetical protein
LISFCTYAVLAGPYLHGDRFYDPLPCSNLLSKHHLNEGIGMTESNSKKRKFVKLIECVEEINGRSLFPEEDEDESKEVDPMSSSAIPSSGVSVLEDLVLPRGKSFLLKQ